MWRPEVVLVPIPTTCISTVPAAGIRTVTVPTIGASASEVKTPEFFHKYLPIPLFIKLYDELY
ncbi:hypothetical protein ACIGC1_27695 [Peribacillus butanolivorans]|uniref:hypothetical protein n=1 Tax=Peribacillus butanolivorans TaxID=421767 RepID=UPI0037C7B88A